MDPSLLDVVLGLALAYSGTYVLYCWLRSEDRKDRRQPDVPRGHSSRRTLA